METPMLAACTSQRCFLAIWATFFALAATLTIAGSASMSAMGAMPMPGGWAMSMTWMRMPGQSWGGAAASFLLMWEVMMAAMMLPSLVPTLWRYRQRVGSAGRMRLELLTALVGAGYFCAWSLLGLLVFALGASVAAAEMQWPSLARLTPCLAGAIVLMGGLLQFSAWKNRQLAHCRRALRNAPVVPAQAWRQGLNLGLHCCLSCANLTAIQWVIGVMDLRAMLFVTLAITAERLAPTGKHVIHAIGVAAIVAGALLIA
jgi:predicted metal-binding membrane protein